MGLRLILFSVSGPCEKNLEELSLNTTYTSALYWLISKFYLLFGDLLILLLNLLILMGVELGWGVGATNRVLTGVEALETFIKGWNRLAFLWGWIGRGLIGLLFIYILTFSIMNRYKINIIINKIKMKGSFTIMRPIKQRSKSAITNNMFQDPDKI